jgi:hypothetical protein
MSISKPARLNKVARDFNVSINTIVDLLEEKGVSVEAKPTTKIDPDMYNLLLGEFTSDKETAAAESKKVTYKVKIWQGDNLPEYHETQFPQRPTNEDFNGIIDWAIDKFGDNKFRIWVSNNILEFEAEFLNQFDIGVYSYITPESQTTVTGINKSHLQLIDIVTRIVQDNGGGIRLVNRSHIAQILNRHLKTGKPVRFNNQVVIVPSEESPDKIDVNIVHDRSTNPFRNIIM